MAEKEVLLKEIHHRVKNNLQVVSSLLSLRARSITDADAARSFDEGLAQIQSMALIHEQLYQAHDLVRLDFGGYVDTLARNILSSHGVEPTAIRLQVDAGPHRVSVDTAIQCGLALHEMVSNALRHAIPGGRGTIRVESRLSGQGRARLRVADDGVSLPACPPDWICHGAAPSDCSW